MKAKLFSGLTPQDIIDNLEAENCGVEDNYKYVKPFSDEEVVECRERLSDAVVQRSRLEARIKELVEPIKEEMKPVQTIIKEETKALDQGGVNIFGRVYYFPDYDANLMGLYNSEGSLIGTRPLTRTERQLHINSFKQVSNG